MLEEIHKGINLQKDCKNLDWRLRLQDSKLLENMVHWMKDISFLKFGIVVFCYSFFHEKANVVT